MGNHCLDGLPTLVTKNWQSVPNRSNTYRNKLTNEYAHKYIINVQDPSQIECFKNRLKEPDPYICRVLYYHQYHDSIYHVITEEMSDNIENHSSSQISNFKLQENDVDKWMRHKLGIMEAFWKLAQIYGFMAVCRQMVGCDGNGNWKVWIHPDPCSHRPWCIAHLESQMLNSLLQVLEQIQRDFDTYLQSPSQQNFQDENRFSTAIRHMKDNLLQRQQKRKQRRVKANKTNSHIENNTTNFNININIELDGKKKKKHQNNTLQNLFNPVICETSRDDEHEQWGHPPKNNQSFGTISYQKQMAKDRPISYYDTSHEKVTPKNYDAKRRISDIAQSTKLIGFGNKSKQDIMKNRQKFLNINKGFKTTQSKQLKQDALYKFQKNLTPVNKSQTPLMNLLASKSFSPKFQPTHFTINQQKTQQIISNPITESSYEMFAKTMELPTYQATTNANAHSRNMNKTSRNEQDFKKSSAYLGRSSKKNIVVSPYERNYPSTNEKLRYETNPKNSAVTKKKNISIPYFLTGTNASTNYSKSKIKGHNSSQGYHCSAYQSDNATKQNSAQNNYISKNHTPKHGTSVNNTNIFYRPNLPTQRKKVQDNNKNKTLFEFYANKYSGNENDVKPDRVKSHAFTGTDTRSSDKMHLNRDYKDANDIMIRPRKNTNQNLKDQLSDILDAPIMQPISQDFEAFKNNKLVYKEQKSEYGGSNTIEHLSQIEQSERAENELIKQKVEKKKATFAHLKMQVMKMLEDDG